MGRSDEPPRSARRGLRDDERVLWSGVTKSIAPLRKRPARPVEASEPVADARPARPRPPVAHTPAPSPPSPKPAPSLTPFGRRERRRLASGAEAIDGRIDLHGRTQAQAHGSLLRFLRDAQARGARTVLVVTGKGGRGDAASERGVLRRQVPQWLGLPEFRALITGFEEAGARHGREGALYVRLRKARG